MGFFEKIKQGLKKTKNSFSGGMNDIFANFRKADEETLEELEELLITADVSFSTAESIISNLRSLSKKDKLKSGEELKTALHEIIVSKMSGDNELKIATKPSIILVVGVNGVGKTTTIGKLSNMLTNQGKSVLIAAADTFRAAAIEQISVWAERSGVDIVRHQDGSDPAAVVFDAIKAGKARGKDVIICDTAGRLHNKKNLMEELTKISRVIERELPEADKEILLVLDATTGQNAISQAKDFKETVGITGVALTKLDGTAKGGVTISVKDETGIPVKLIGVGEQADDLQPFDAESFAKALLDED
ncbi:MAG: signal recognition particle-docking protein FtsY [Clostridiales bacterium]|nr:signal recognition particle-docking protein FtsY [Clostridiales bacterium]